MQDEPNENRLIGVFTTDTNLSVQVWDDAMRQITGIEAGDAIGKKLTELVPDISDRGLLRRFEQVRELGTSEVLAPAFHKFLFRRPTRIPSAHFTEMRQLVKISALHKEDKICGLMVIIEDVTERLEHERSLAAMLKDPDDSVRLRAARDISRGSEPLSSESSQAIIDALGDKSWRVRRKLVEGLSRRLAPDAVTALLDAVRKEHLDFGLLNSALKVLQATSFDTTKTLVDFLGSGDIDLRVQAALALGEQKDPAAIPALLASLSDSDANVRYHAIEALGKLRAAEAVEPLLSIAETRDFFLAFPALEALARIGGEGIARRLSPLLDDKNVREVAVETLGAVGDISAVGPIAELLNDGRIAAPAAANALGSLFDRYEADGVGGQVVEAVRKAINTEGAQALAAALDTAREKDIPALVRVAGWADDDAVRQGLGRLLERPDFRDLAARALSAHGDTAVSLLIEKLSSEDPGVRAAAARALGESGSSLAVDALIEVLSTEDTILRRAAVTALGSIARPETAPRFCSLIENADPKVREALVRIMGTLQAPECESAVLTASADPDDSVRVAAVEQLANFPGEQAFTRLKEALRNGVPQVRAAAARVLGKWDREEAVRALRPALSDPDPWTRYFAVRSLAEKNDEESFEILRKLSENDEAEQVRVAAAEALAGR